MTKKIIISSMIVTSMFCCVDKIENDKQKSNIKLDKSHESIFNNYQLIQNELEKNNFIKKIIKENSEKEIVDLACKIDLNNHKQKILNNKFIILTYGYFREKFKNLYIPQCILDLFKQYISIRSNFIKDNLIFKYISLINNDQNKDIKYQKRSQIDQKFKNQIDKQRQSINCYPLKIAYSNALDQKDIKEIVYLYPIMLQTPRLINICLPKYMKEQSIEEIIQLLDELELPFFQNQIHTIFYYAIKNNSLELIKILLKKDFNINLEIKYSVTKTLVDIACYDFNEEVLKLFDQLLNKNYYNLYLNSLNKIVDSTIEDFGSKETIILKLIKKNGVDYYYGNQTILHLTSKYGKIRLFDILLNKGANLLLTTKDTKDNILHIAAKKYNINFIKYLSKKCSESVLYNLGQSLNNKGHNALFCFAFLRYNGNINIFSEYEILSNNFHCNPNIVDNSGRIILNQLIQNISFKNVTSTEYFDLILSHLKEFIEKANFNLNMVDCNNKSILDIIKEKKLTNLVFHNKLLNLFENRLNNQINKYVIGIEKEKQSLISKFDKDEEINVSFFYKCIIL